MARKSVHQYITNSLPFSTTSPYEGFCPPWERGNRGGGELEKLRNIITNRKTEPNLSSTHLIQRSAIIFFSTQITENKHKLFKNYSLITTEKKTYDNVTLPAVVKVKRHHLDGQRIKITSENYKFNDIVLTKTVNGMAFGNILIGGLIGWGIDLSTNCVSKPEKTEFTITPLPKEEK